MLQAMPLALGNLWITFIALGSLAALGIAIYAIMKMRSDDFWEEQG
jgi:hypothetical protein